MASERRVACAWRFSPVQVDKNGLTCQAGVSSIATEAFHGILHNGADSGEAAQAFRFDGARCSDGMSPRARSLAG